MQIVDTAEVTLARHARGGRTAEILSHLEKMKPGQTLLIDVDGTDIEDLDAFAKANKIEEEDETARNIACSRVLANQTKTRMMASLSGQLPQQHYFTARLAAPDDDGFYSQIAILCLPAQERPARKPRTSKKAKA
jgi:hypothetical protein